jgi:putative CocE/NonD family hydrolase
VGGWYDIFIRGTITNFTGLRQRAGSQEARQAQKLLVGPWYHSPWIPVTGVINFGDAARQPVDEWQLRWFDQFLKDEDTSVLDQPVTVFLMGENRWIEEADWPPRGSEMQEFYLHSDGDANPVNRGGSLSLEAPGSEPPDIFVYDPLAPTPSVGGHSCCIPILTPMGPEDQASVEVLNGVLVYTSPRLEKDLAVMGPVRITLYAATSAVDTDWTAKLCDVSPSGKSINIQEGIIRARFRKSLNEPELLEPYEVYKYSIDLGSTAHVFRAGHRIRLQVSSSDFPQWDRSLNTGGDLGTEGAERAVVAQQFVLHDGEHPSRLSLMVAR